MNSINSWVIEGPLTLHPTAAKDTLRKRFEQTALPQLSKVYSAAFFLTGNRDDAEDLVQETFARGFRFFDRFEPGTNCRAWLLSIMRNLFYTGHRTKQSQPSLVSLDGLDGSHEALNLQDAGESDPSRCLVARSMDDKVARALAQLPLEFRTAVTLVDLEDLTYEEAGTVMDIPVGTVRSRVSRGRRLLHAALKDYAVRHGFVRGS